METMEFQIPKLVLFKDNIFFLHLSCTIDKLALIRNCPRGCMYMCRSNNPIGY